MRTRSNSRRREIPLACTIGLALLTANAAPGHSQTATGTAATPTTTAAKAPVPPTTATVAKPAPATTAPAAKAPATGTKAPQPTTTTTPTTKAPAPSTTTAATTKAPATTTTAATTKAPAATAPAAAKATATPTATKAATTATTAPAAKKPAEGADMALRGGQEGTVFKSLTVEGEDRVRVDFERPELKINVDLDKAPGLDWGSAVDVLNRTNTDLQAPLLALSAKQMTPYLARPWLTEFATGPVARFHPNAEGVERWKLVVVNSKGAPVTTFSGKGDPPKEITWDGRAANGTPVTPGLTYSYVFEAFDRAGNKRNVVGQGFTVAAYRIESPEGPTLLLSGSELQSSSSAQPATATGAGETPTAPPILLEAASWLNQSGRLSQPIRVTVTARSQELADLIAGNVKRSLAPFVLGDPARLETVALAEADAPEAGTLTIAATK